MGPPVSLTMHSCPVFLSLLLYLGVNPGLPYSLPVATPQGISPVLDSSPRPFLAGLRSVPDSEVASGPKLSPFVANSKVSPLLDSLRQASLSRAVLRRKDPEHQSGVLAL